MRTTPIALAMFLAFAGGSLAARDPVPVAKAQASQRALYLVDFVEPPLASYRGEGDALGAKFGGLKATSPAVTGARKLDVGTADSKAYRAALAAQRAERLARFGARIGRVLEPAFVYDVVSNGVALELDADEARLLAKSDGVRDVQPDFVRRVMTDAGPAWINADALWDGSAGVQTRGERIVLGIIDSGVNRTHPSFAATGPVDGFVHTNPKGRLFGRCADALTATDCNTKLIGLYDFTSCTGVHTSTSCNDREGNDGTDIVGHGSHVASIAAGNVLGLSLTLPGGAATRTVSGVAPHANVISYKACEEEETCRGTWLKAALDQAVADGVDVINYSIGGGQADPWTSPDSLAMLAAREAGAFVVVSAGNEGPEAGSVTSPSNSPWVLTAANASHDRGVVNRVVDLTGGATPPPLGGVLVGLGSTLGIGPRPIVIDPQFPGCGIGTDLDANQSGASNPWPVGRFNGEIVVCERGVQARLAKSANVRLAGGGGMILVNTAVEGESLVADAHSIPSSHIGFAAGVALKAWLASGSGHQGRIEGTQVRSVPEFADILSSSSGRGPLVINGLMKPDLTAPGSNILAAAGSGTGGAFLSGTSMAAPHLAGAAALLSAARPEWSPSQIESALMTTARPDVVLQDGITPATPFDQGAGVADVGKAATPGLYFNITPAEFRAANPSTGGTPRALNRPSLVHENCFERCSMSRRVTDQIGGGSWRVEVDLPSPASATVTPSTFTLAAGQSATVAFDFDVSDASFPGRWVDGRIRFVRTSGAPSANAEVPVTLFAQPGALPARMDIAAASESGFQDLALSGLVSLPQADFEASPLVAPVATERSLMQDTTRNEIYDSFGGGHLVKLIPIPAASTAGGRVFRVFADVRSATAYDVDLYVGQDSNGNGAPDEDEQGCVSGSTRATEHCELEVVAGAAPSQVWVYAQNWDSGQQGEADALTASDVVVMETALVAADAPSDGTLVATGPGHTPARATFPLRVSWDDPTLLPGERRYGMLRIGASAAHPGQVGRVPVAIHRATSVVNAPAVLAPNATRHMRLAAGAAQDRLYFDVPPNASSLTVSTSGTGEVDLYLAKATTPSSPDIAAAPARGQASGTSIHAGASESITLTAAALSAGRWYVTPVNAGTTIAEFDLTLTLQATSARPLPKFGAYYNPQRDGAGLFLFPANGGSVWSLVWYTYLQDGTPTWYLGVAAAPGAQDGVWKVSMERYSWDGDANQGTPVGEAQLALTSATGFNFSWNLDGESGSEPMSFIDGGGCPTLNGSSAALTGMWYSPSKAGFGYAINAYPTLETNAFYFYDGLGIARWALGTASPFGTPTLSMAQYDGFCPLCAYRAPTTAPIGTLTRRYDSASAGNIGVALQLRAPLAGSWNVDLPAARLTDALQCQ